MSGFRFVEKLANAPWMCDEAHLQFLHGVFLGYRDRIAAGETLDVKALQEQVGRPLDNTRKVTVQDGVARIPVEGTIMRRANLFTDISGGVSTEALMRDFVTAYDNPNVHSVLFVFDSPGGEALGISELADAIRSRRDLGDKRIEAYCDGQCCSAAYYLASATEHITTDARAIVGSIGTVIQVRNPDAAGKQLYLEFWNSRSPKKRVDPTSQSGKEAIQEFIDDLGEEFIAAVADNRGVTVEKVVEDFGQGWVMIGRKALAAGMADAIGSEQSVIERLRENRGARPLVTAASAYTTLHPISAVQSKEVLTVMDNATQITPTASEAPGEARGHPEEAEDHSREGIVSRMLDFLGIPTAAQATTQEDSTQDDNPAETAGDGKEQHDVTDNDSATPANEATGMPESNGEANARVEALERELEDARAEAEAARGERAEAAARLRERGVEAMLQKASTWKDRDGKTYAMPPPTVEAVKTVISTLAAFGSDHDVVSVSSDGTANIKTDTPAGKAVADLLGEQRPVQLGERGAAADGASEGEEMSDHDKVTAALEERGLDKSHYAAVAGELAAKGEIRRN